MNSGIARHPGSIPLWNRYPPMNIKKLIRKCCLDGSSGKYSPEKLAALIGCPPAAVIASLGFMQQIPGQWFLTVIGLVLFGIILIKQSTPKRAFFAVLIFGTVFHTVSLSWILNVMTSFGEMPFVLALGIIVFFCMYFSLLPALGAGISVKLIRTTLWL